MPENVTDILMGGARVLNAPVGEALPDVDTILYGAAWGGNWAEVGFTSTPVAWKHSFDEKEVDVQQRIAAIDRQRTKEELMLETKLAEITSDTLQLALGGTAAIIVPASGVVGRDELTGGGEVVLDKRTWGFEGLYVGADGTKRAVRLQVFIATSTINGDLEFSKTDEAGIPLQVRGLADTGKAVGADLFKFLRVTADALA